MTHAESFQCLEKVHSFVAAPAMDKPNFRIVWEYDVDAVGDIHLVAVLYRVRRGATLWFFDHPTYGFYGLKSNGERT